MVVELPNQACRDTTAVGATVQGEVVPVVGVAFRDAGRQIRRVRHDAVEPSQSVGEVRADRGDVESFDPGERG